MSIVVICPSRGRPDKAHEAYESFTKTKRGPGTEMIFVIDFDDNTREGYSDLPFRIPEHAGGMGNALNAAALDCTKANYDIIGFVGDDHRFRTEAWDEHIERTLTEAGGGIAYGNDLVQSINLPTQVFISSSIIKALGWMALPGAMHLYLDNAWKTLGEKLDRLFYFPEIVIEHMHPTAGKAEWDEGYKRVNDTAIYQHDALVYAEWLLRADDDIERIREALG